LRCSPGFLYFQGEIDAVDPKEDPKRIFLPHQWADRFIVFIKNWRHDLNLHELPVVFAQIGTNTEPERFKNWSIVKIQQNKVRLQFSTMINTDDLVLKDYVNFTTESYRIIGQRFAKSYLNLLAGDKQKSKSLTDIWGNNSRRNKLAVDFLVFRSFLKHKNSYATYPE
jgi:hypothetical protein